MPNNSSTGGYLFPSGNPPEGAALMDLIQTWLVNLSGLTGDKVRPVWQSEPPNIPVEGTCWAAFRVGPRESDAYPYQKHDPAASAGAGVDEMHRHETLPLLVSVYDTGVTGQADNTAALIRDNAVVPQNLEVLTLAGMGLVSTGNITPVPSLLKERWLYRVDVEIKLRRVITRQYPVENVDSAQATLYTDTGLPPVPINVQPPA